MCRKIKSYLLFLLILVFAFGTFASYASSINDYEKQAELKIDKLVTERFTGKNDFVPVLIMLNEQADVEKVSLQTNQKMRADGYSAEKVRQTVREAVVRELEKVSESTQKGLLSYLKSQQKKGNIKEYESFHIVNMVYALAREKTIKEIAARREVKRIYIDGEVYLIGDENEVEKAVEPQAPSPSDIEWNIKHINADDVWNQYNIDGTGVVVATIDGGVKWDHKALKEKYRGYDPASGRVDHRASWYDAWGGRSTPYDDEDSHGTHVMGTIVGQESNGRNAVGVAPGAKFIAVKGLGMSNNTDSKLIRAAEWLLRPGGSTANAPDVVNNSWGGGSGKDDWYKNVMNAWRAADIVPVFAAGNHSGSGEAPAGSISNPANYPEVIAVAAINSSNRRASWSCVGPSPYDSSLIKPEISAPGVSIRSSVISGGYESGWSGTSMAAPHITGVIALMRQANPYLTVSEIETILKNTAKPLTDSRYRNSPNMGYGYGAVDALAAVEAALAMAGPQTGTITGRITDYNTGSGISGARVSVSGTSLSAYTNSSGYYTIYDVPAGRHEIVATANGYQSESRNVTVNANQQTTVNIALRRVSVTPTPTPTPAPTPPPGQKGTITGRIVNTSGYGIGNAFVYCGGISVTTNYNGYFTLNDVPAGSQLFFAGAAGYFSAIGNIEVNAGNTINIEIVLENPGFSGAGGNNIGVQVQSIPEP